ncbi:MAG TPA: hypothetical protein ENK15_05775 [Thermopetrobacter sp.]|nr:hypothetical protein [Thermopetrobacter sp.]
MAGFEDNRQWHLDRRVPISLIVAIVMQTVAAAWWAASMQARIEALERSANASDGQRDRIVRLESDIAYIKSAIERIERQLVPALFGKNRGK